MNLETFFRRLLFPAGVSAEKANTNGDPVGAEAQFERGRRLAEGESPDLQQARDCYRRAAEQGHAAAQFNLGVLYAQGRGVPRDDSEALTWIRKAAEGGNAGAQHNLGARCHRASVHRPQADSADDRIEAYKWLRLAADQGHNGSAAACERVTLSMSGDEVVQGNQRTASFGGVRDVAIGKGGQ